MVARRKLSDTDRDRALGILGEGYGVTEVGRRLNVTWSVIGRLRDIFSDRVCVRTEKVR